MAESFVPQNTTVVCTNMTISTPQMIKITSPSNVMYSTKTQPFLTISDNKISASFQCKSPAKFWGGLQALALGIAIGAAIVLTGGAAAVVIVAACAVSVGAGVTGLYKMAHDCDATLQRKWIDPHPKVRFNGEAAILNRSYLNCPKQGRLTIIMDPVIAQRAAEFISSNNTKEVATQMGSQFVMGLIMCYTAGLGVGAISSVRAAYIAAGINTAIPLAMYYPAEEFGGTDFASNHEGAANVATAVASDAVSAGAGAATAGISGGGVGGAIINANVKNAVQGAAQYGAGSVTGNVSKSMEGAFRNYFGQRGVRANGFAGYKGIAGFIANIAIGTFADKYENRLSKETWYKADVFDKSDKSNGVTVIATNS